MSKRLVPWFLAVACVVGCGDPEGDSGYPTCTAGACQDHCIAAGYPGGTCDGLVCRCTGASDGGDVRDSRDYGGETDPCAPPSCGPSELCGASGQGDGVDNDCDGEVDEGCTCEGVGTTLECFAGDPAICPPGLPCRGGCTRGVETCTEFAIWGGCIGAVGPQPEICDGMDNDCDGRFDEDLSGCSSPVVCPGTKGAAPMTYVPLNGSEIFSGAYDSWQWELFCPVTVPTCPTPEDPTARDTQVLLIASGTYRARATMVIGGETFTCEFAIAVQGAGFRVELNWDTQGSAAGDTDVDLHLHKWGDPPTDFFDMVDDCYYLNCKASTCCGLGGRPQVNWGLGDTSDLSACRDAPHGEGSSWEGMGFCANPRLDVDVITCTTGDTDPTSSSFCAPENINVDNPPLGMPMRVMVNYYSQHSYSGITNATINIYCGGALRATLGPEQLVVGGGYGESNDNWLVADVQFYEGPCGMLDCEIIPLDAVQTGPAFGPPWSSFTMGP
jgi:hypothetical protein